MDNWYRYGYFKLDQSIIVYSVGFGKVYGGSDTGRTVKQVQKDSDGYLPGGDYTMELDLSNRSLVMWINNEKIILDGNIGDLQFSPIVIFVQKFDAHNNEHAIEMHNWYLSTPSITLL